LEVHGDNSATTRRHTRWYISTMLAAATAIVVVAAAAAIVGVVGAVGTGGSDGPILGNARLWTNLSVFSRPKRKYNTNTKAITI
jgi:hypothetical protein